jgi:CcmD family protein
MRNKLSYLITFLMTAITWPLIAQGRNVEMADALRANGKIYVVVLVVGIIFAGIIVYLIWIDRKLSRLEKEMKK